MGSFGFFSLFIVKNKIRHCNKPLDEPISSSIVLECDIKLVRMKYTDMIEEKKERRSKSIEKSVACLTKPDSLSSNRSNVENCSTMPHKELSVVSRSQWTIENEKNQ